MIEENLYENQRINLLFRRRRRTPSEAKRALNERRFQMEMRADPHDNNILSSFDFSAIEEMDPSVRQGCRLIYEKELDFNLRIQEPSGDFQDATTEEKIRVRIFLQGDEKNPEEIRIELDSEADLFFYYQHVADRSNFREIKAKQQLQIDFAQYAGVLVKSFGKCEKDAQHYYILLTIATDLTGVLQIVQTSEYKDIELIAFDFQSATEEGIRQQITFKYGALKSKLSLMDGRMQDINELVRIKNPSLLLQIQKGPPGRASPRKRKY